MACPILSFHTCPHSYSLIPHMSSFLFSHSTHVLIPILSFHTCPHSYSLIPHMSSFNTCPHSTHVLIPILSFQFKVMQRQLVLLHSAFAAYFSGNHSVMESLVEEFHDKLDSKRSQRSDPPTWLENLDDSAQ